MVLKFLIVDDSKAMQTIVKRILINAGYEQHDFKFESNGRNALESIRNWQPDIVLLDWHMPEMTGIELLEKVKELNLNTKIGLITAEKNKVSIERAKKAGARFVVNKPFTAENLQESLIPALSEDHSPQQSKVNTNQIVFPSPSALTILLSAVTNSKILVEKVEPLEIKNFSLPATLALFGNSEQKVKALLLLEADTRDRLAEAFSLTVFSGQAIDDKLLARALVNVLSIIGVNFLNLEEMLELKLIKTYNIPKLINKIQLLNTAQASDRLDIKITFKDGFSAYSVFYLESSGSY
ncbi:response regulator [Aliikangiella sp. IMCC44359]|uniref:response regulator n=1 Tax=Aliikangiella sp. IMCC44359 TaxID=3459125 RepID=UPI00403AB64B